ncbi:hypothetical protein BCR33DRAFT_716399 [Rhizoclosmatium globosum]|uniref:Uncharacterized protein n=1 Tax=Rhizoclosmatium globosum TaxID=329046 RepID=A0A1Y2CDP8_9FUNG|nr:hypothetical protein BCR33DRAFT_716399 [Rhizoclosmatium globosum]|eukprot:ORY45046.1 hypothetical protein BCR33DRAFT_716399 [Rhizoclosmatium globosum]
MNPATITDGTQFLAWTDAQKTSALFRLAAEEGGDTVSLFGQTPQFPIADADFELFATVFAARKNTRIALSHKEFIRKTFLRFRPFFPNLTAETVHVHDNSKLNSFIEVIGYTEKWVHGTTIHWEAAKQHHYDVNSHHPEFHHGNEMTASDLEESVVDMLAIQWERRYGGDDTVPAATLVTIDDVYLQRYVVADRPRVRQLLDLIAKSDL